MLLDWSSRTVSRVSHLLNLLAVSTLITSLVTNQWVVSEERVLESAKNPEMLRNLPGMKLKNYNYTTRRTESGMFLFCQQEPEQEVDCYWIPHVVPDHTKLVDPRNATTCILYATMISMPSLVSAAGLTFLGLLTNLLMRFRKVWIFVTGVSYILGGLCTFTCLVLFITHIVQELDHKGDEKGADGDLVFTFTYGYSMILAMVAFCTAELGGIGLVYLGVMRYREHWTKKDRLAERNSTGLMSFDPDYYDEMHIHKINHRHQPNHTKMELTSNGLWEMRNGSTNTRLQRRCLTETDLDIRTRDIYIGNHYRSYNEVLPNQYPLVPIVRNHSTRSAQSSRSADQASFSQRTVTFSDNYRTDVPDGSSYQPNTSAFTYAYPTKEQYVRAAETDWRMTPV